MALSKLPFEIEELCDILISYLDYDTIINLDKSNQCQHDIFNSIKTQQIFRTYLNSWKANKKEICKCIENDLWNYGYCKYTLFTINCEDADDIDRRDKMIDIVPNITLDDTIDDATFDDIDCYYCSTDKTYKYNLNDYMQTCTEIGDFDGWWHQVDKELKYKFANHEFDSLLSKVNDFIAPRMSCIKQKESLVDRLRELWNIPNNDKILKMIKNWYLHVIEGLENEQELKWTSLAEHDADITIYAHIDNDILPEDFIVACKKYQNPPYEHDNCDTFFVCRMRVYAEYC